MENDEGLTMKVSNRDVTTATTAQWQHEPR